MLVRTSFYNVTFQLFMENVIFLSFALIEIYIIWQQLID